MQQFVEQHFETKICFYQRLGLDNNIALRRLRFRFGTFRFLLLFLLSFGQFLLLFN